MRTASAGSLPSLLGGALIFAFALLAGPVFAEPAQSAPAGIEQGVEQGGEDEASIEVARKPSAIASRTMSPFCPGRTLPDCPSPNATEWRADIRSMVARGMSADEIQDVLESRSGGNLSGSPHREVGYAVPIGFALLAGFALLIIFRRLRSGDPSRGASSDALEDVDDARLADELAAESGGFFDEDDEPREEVSEAKEAPDEVDESADRAL